MDSLKDYFSEFIIITKNSRDRIKTTDLLASYSSWQSKNDDRFIYNQRSFNKDVISLGVPKKESNGIRFFSGLLFKPLIIEKEKEIVNIPIPVITPIKVVTPISKSSLIKDVPIKKKFHDKFIKFKDFSLHVPSFIAISGVLPSDIVYLFENPFDLNSSLNLLVSKRTNLSNSDKANLYRNNILSFKNMDPEKSAYLILSTGLQYSRSLFHRDLLLCDTYDEFYSYCNNNPSLAK